MYITVTQPDTPNASTGVRIFIDGKYIGTIGPGEIISGESCGDPNTVYEVEAVCGFYRASYHGNQDVTLSVEWVLAPPRMELRKRK